MKNIKIQIIAYTSLTLAIFLPFAMASAQTYYPSPSQAAASSAQSITTSTSASSTFDNSSSFSVQNTLPMPSLLSTTTSTTTSNMDSSLFGVNTSTLGGILNVSGISVAESSTGAMMITIQRNTLINLLQQIQMLLVQLNSKLAAK